ncbi:hypothetical protein ACLEDU_06535 [Lonsdalea quercina]
MDKITSGTDVLFVAGFNPITTSATNAGLITTRFSRAGWRSR